MNQQAGQQQLVQPGAGSYVLPPRLDLREELERSRQEGDVASTKQSAKKGASGRVSAAQRRGLAAPWACQL